MHTLLKTKMGPFLVISSVLAVWMLLAVHHVQAHSLTDPSCSSLPTADSFFTTARTAALSNGTATATARPEKGTGESGEGNKSYYYAKITVPPLTAGELVVSDDTSASETYSSEAILCGRQEGSVSSLSSYASAHTTADNAAAAALRAQAIADAANTSGTAAMSAETAARNALNSAANALARYSGTTLNGGIAYALRRAADATSDATAESTLNNAANMAIVDSNTARVASGRDAIDTSTDTPTMGVATDGDATSEAGALTAAAEDLRIAAHALDPNMVFNINTVISSGDEEYVVVMTAPEGGTPRVTATFRGVMSTVVTAPDGGSFTQNNQQDPHTLRATHPGLLTVRTTGNEVDTKGTLSDGTANIAVDEDSRSNFEIVSPMDDDADYTVSVAGQTRGERGDYGLKVEFRVAIDLGTAASGDAGITRAGEILEFGRADYFFFTVAPTTYRFLTVRTQKHADVTTETDTTGTFYGYDGQITTDTNSGLGNNFLFRVPISAGDYIVEVDGQTGGRYALVLSSQASTTRGSAPNMIAAATEGTLAAADPVPYSITVSTPGTLQVKTTGDIDTVGVLYGPDGRQIATDDNSGAGMNFLITEYVEAGLYIVTVEGQTRATTGMYTVVTNFVEGADIDVGTRPGTGTGTGTEEELRNQIADLRDDLDTCLMPVETDTRGNLENPSGSEENPAFRSGIGVISGWVCAASEVEVRILRAPGVEVDRVRVGYGTSRPDVPENSSCTNSHAGFGATYNFNHLPEGMYTITAYADGEMFSEARTFEVVHIVRSFPDSNNFLELDDEVQDRGVCIVPDFPVTGERTWLKWEQSTQNFVIEDAG